MIGPLTVMIELVLVLMLPSPAPNASVVEIVPPLLVALVVMMAPPVPIVSGTLPPTLKLSFANNRPATVTPRLAVATAAAVGVPAPVNEMTGADV